MKNRISSSCLILLSIFIAFAKGICNSTVAQNLKLIQNWFTNRSQLLPEGYNEFPPHIQGCPVNVTVSIHPIVVRDISVMHMKFEVDLYIVVLWLDNRLRLPEDIDVKGIKVPSDVASQMWTPSLNFKNCLKCSGLTFNPQKNVIKLYGNHAKIFWRRLENFHCDFDLSSYPFDVQMCYVEIIADKDEKISVTLIDMSSHEIISSSTPPEFQLIHLSSGQCSKKDLTTEHHSCIEYEFKLRRQIGHHIIIVYIPSMLVVALTWISFWLDLEATAPRVTLGLTTLLTLATQFSNAQKNLPPVAYMKAIDVWMVTCMFMVVGSLVEFAIAYWQAQKQNLTVFRIPKKNIVSYFARSYTRAPMETRRQSTAPPISPIDRIARFIFPGFFLIFNAVYWSYYCSR